ncbi:MAG: antibiotic biosynthesis monooxygenase family protein [Bacteroidota bacterium]
MTSQPYTLALWTVKPGMEKQFIEEWNKFATWSAQHQPGAFKPSLLHSVEHPLQFVSFGGWEDVEKIKTWRSLPEFSAFVERAKKLCDNFTPGMYSLTATSP